MADYGIEIDDAGMAGVIPGTTLAADPYSAHPTAGEAGIAAGTGSGQHGIVPILGGGTMGETITSIWDWINTPFTRPMSPMTIFAITGSILIAVIVWNFIIYHIRIAAEAI